MNTGLYTKTNNSTNSGSAYGPEKPTWSFGPRSGRSNSFYCTHISCVQRLSNGNTLSKYYYSVYILYTLYILYALYVLYILCVLY